VSVEGEDSKQEEDLNRNRETGLCSQLRHIAPSCFVSILAVETAYRDAPLRAVVKSRGFGIFANSSFSPVSKTSLFESPIDLLTSLDALN
jgi:hypothetical protein